MGPFVKSMIWERCNDWIYLPTGRSQIRMATIWLYLLHTPWCTKQLEMAWEDEILDQLVYRGRSAALKVYLMRSRKLCYQHVP